MKKQRLVLLTFFSLPIALGIVSAGWLQAGEPQPESAACPNDRAESLAPLPEAQWDHARARHLLVRAGFGGTAEEISRLHSMGLEKAVDHLVDFEQAGEFNCPLEIGPRPAPDLPKGVKRDSDEARKIRQEAQRAESRQFRDLQKWWVQRMVESPRPLEEKMTLFWHGLLVSGYRTVRDSYAMYHQNELYRKNAAGNYGDMLHGIVRDPAMLRYLDNNSNVRGRPNENLAREIMELFSMGEGQGYTEKDIQEGARALTGNTYDREARFAFRERSHDGGQKTIFGKTGNFDGDDFVDLILAQPATADYIASKLFAFFAHEDPNPAIIDALAAQFRCCDYELKPVLKTLFRSEAFYSERSVGRQVKSPVQLVVGTVRAFDITVENYGSLVPVMASMEQELLEPPNVKGWDGGEAWMNTTTVFHRYNLAGLVESHLKLQLQKAGKPGAVARRDAVSLLAGKSFKDAADVVDYLGKSLFAIPLSPEKRARLIAFLDESDPLPPSAQWEIPSPNFDRWKLRARINDKLTGLITLMMSMPEYQVT